MMAAPIRFKKVEECTNWDTTSQGGQECINFREMDVPIRDWNFTPESINTLPWMVGTKAPDPIYMTVVIPELNELYKDFGSNFRIRIKKYYVGEVDFVKFTSFESFNNSGYFSYSDVNRGFLGVLLNFQNLDNLPIGNNTAEVVFEAYGVDRQGNEIYKESSLIKEKKISISFNVIGNGNSFNTDKNEYNITYNKADKSLSGDEKITVYTEGAISYSSTEDFVSLVESTGASQRYLAFQKTAGMDKKEVGNYSAVITLQQGEIRKTVTLRLKVINDDTMFYLSPERFDISLQKNLREKKTLTCKLSNPNNLDIQVLLKPSFIEEVRIENDKVIMVTQSSDRLLIGNYSGEVILEAGAVRKKIKINLSVIQNVEHDFEGQAYYFALDRNKVILTKTEQRSRFARMKLEMYFKGYGEEFREEQEYDVPFFKGKAEFYPGEEIQDFFIRARELLVVENKQYLMNFAIVTITFYQMGNSNEIYSVTSLNDLYFVPGKKPKCFPYFTDYPVRRIQNKGQFTITLDRKSAQEELKKINAIYKENVAPNAEAPCLDRYLLKRERFDNNLENKVLKIGDKLILIPFSEKRELILIEWETDNLVFDWFTAPMIYQKKQEIEVVVGASKYYKEEKFSGGVSTTLVVNTGWILREEIPLITDLLRSRLCFITIGNERLAVYPMGKKNELEDSEESLYQMDLEFKVLQS